MKAGKIVQYMVISLYEIITSMKLFIVHCCTENKLSNDLKALNVYLISST